jgi:hypothetical protein
MLGRATIVGERSGGGAHAAVPLRIDSHFRVIVPLARSPDVRVREELAAQAAHRAALQDVLKQNPAFVSQEGLQRQIDALTATLQSKR